MARLSANRQRLIGRASGAAGGEAEGSMDTTLRAATRHWKHGRRRGIIPLGGGLTMFGGDASGIGFQLSMYRMLNRSKRLDEIRAAAE